MLVSGTELEQGAERLAARTLSVVGHWEDYSEIIVAQADFADRGFRTQSGLWGHRGRCAPYI